MCITHLTLRLAWLTGSSLLVRNVNDGVTPGEKGTSTIIAAVRPSCVRAAIVDRPADRAVLDPQHPLIDCNRPNRVSLKLCVP